MAIDQKALEKWRALGFTTWEPFDHDSPDEAIAFLRRDAEAQPLRPIYKTELDAAIDLFAAVWAELQYRRSADVSK